MKPAPNPRYAAFLADLKTLRRPFSHWKVQQCVYLCLHKC
jgi:hypothetical protein